jgi:hypothetical protein
MKLSCTGKLLKKLALPCVLFALLFTSWVSGFCAETDFQISQASDGDRIVLTVTSGGNHKVDIDDAAGFRQPVLTQTFNGRQFEFAGYEAGLAPGVDYYVRVDRSAAVKRLRISEGEIVGSFADCATLRLTWETIARPIVEKRSTIHWQTESGRWVPSPPGIPDGLDIYFVELFARSGLEWAQSCNDFALYDELSQYYLVMLQQTVPLGQVERRPVLLPGSRTGMMADRTFPAGPNLVGDLDLGNAQWLYPAAKLERLISLLPESQRSPAMRQFMSQFTGFLVNEQLLRFLMRPGRPAPGGGPDVSRVEVWTRTLRGIKGVRVWDTAMSDVDLWLIASSAEILGAHANDPGEIKLDETQVNQLHAALDVGIRLFRSKRTVYPDTRNLQGQRVGSATYFNGDYDGYDDLAFSAVTGPDFPTLAQKRPIPNLSWDTAHAYRIPVFMRALYDNKKATKSEFPKLEEMKLLTNQYVYRVFDGNFSRPLFRNYLDGNDTWFRVDLEAKAGYPPSEFCDDGNSKRPCTAPGSVAGWGLLAFVNPDLGKVERSLIELAFQPDTDARQFRDRHYTYTWRYDLLSQNSRNVYGDVLFFVTADNSPMISRREGNLDSQ